MNIPGDRPDRFDKAIASRADVVVIDLEDTVAPDAKDFARAAVAQWISPAKPVMLRVNAYDTPWFEGDLGLAGDRGILGIMLPKAEPNATTARVAETSPAVALIECARGVAGMMAFGFDYAGLHRFALGDMDLLLDLGISAGPAIFDPIRLQMVVVSRLRELAPPIDGVSLNIDDMEAVRRDAQRANAIGFSGKLAIHPRQVDAIVAAFRPTNAEIDRAKHLVEADRVAAGSASSLNGLMVDKPFVERARRLLASLKDA